MKKNKYVKDITKAVGTQTAIVTMTPIPFHIAGAGKGLSTHGQTAMGNVLRTSAPMYPMAGMIPTIQVSKSLMGSLDEIGKVGKKRKR